MFRSVCVCVCVCVGGSGGNRPFPRYVTCDVIVAWPGCPPCWVAKVCHFSLSGRGSFTVFTMVHHCCAFGCNSRQKSSSGVHFYRFPANKERRQRWIAAVRRDNWEPTIYSRLCSRHFISGKWVICDYIVASLL